MKLSKVQIGKILSQFPALVLVKDHLTVSQFRELFGRHTFFLDDRGLNVLELLEVPGMEVEEGEMVRLADWSDMGFTRLTTHPPEPTGIVVCLKEVRH
jgi:hypothetical protein